MYYQSPLEALSNKIILPIDFLDIDIKKKESIVRRCKDKLAPKEERDMKSSTTYTHHESAFFHILEVMGLEGNESCWPVTLR